MSEIISMYVIDIALGISLSDREVKQEKLLDYDDSANLDCIDFIVNVWIWNEKS